MDVIGCAHQTQVDGMSVAWGELGSGPPLVLLHGLQDSHRAWRRVAHALASRFRVLMPDLPGHGWSARPDAPYTLPWFAQAVARWMDVIGVEQAHVCGHSFGGGVALWMLLDHRSRVTRLALVASGGLGKEVGMGMRMAAFPVLGPALAPTLMHVGVPVFLRLFPAAVGHIERHEATLVVNMLRIPGTDRAFQRSLAGVVNVFGQHQQMLPRAGEILSPPPMALFWGEKDPIIPLQHAKDLLQHSSGITLQTYPRCGHFPHLDAPQAFAQDLLAFLSDHQRAAARIWPTAPPAASPDRVRHTASQ